MAAGGPPAAATTAVAPSVAARTRPTEARIRSRRTRSAIVASNGVKSAAAAMRAPVTMPTAPTPPSRNATTASPTMNALSLIHIAPNESCARRIDWLGATFSSERVQTRPLGERRRDME